MRWCIIQHLIEFFKCVLGRCILVGRDLVERRDHGWVYCTDIVQKGAVDGLYMTGVCGVEMWQWDLLSRELNIFTIFLNFMDMGNIGHRLVVCFGIRAIRLGYIQAWIYQHNFQLISNLKLNQGNFPNQLSIWNILVYHFVGDLHYIVNCILIQKNQRKG